MSILLAVDDPRGRQRHRRLLKVLAILVLLALVLLGGPAANWLQLPHRQADPAQPWDAVYLVCGARAQQRRIRALIEWLARTPSPPPVILVGNDPQRSFWSHDHQRNLTRTEWGVNALEQWHRARYAALDAPPAIQVVPGAFSNTDGEMQALAAFLRRHPYRRVALVTSRFHARRAVARLENRTPEIFDIAIIPGAPNWENRAPWIVAAEYLKLLRDTLGHAQTPLLSRQEHSHLKTSIQQERGYSTSAMNPLR